MFVTCQACGAKIEVGPSGSYCPYCGSFVEAPKAQHTSEPLYEQKSSLVNEPVETKKQNAARDVYENNIDGVCIIDNIEDSATGSGFIYKKSGLVITNAHVIYYDKKSRPSNDIKVHVNGKVYDATVINSNKPEGDDDIALVQIKSNDYFHELEIGNFDEVHNGDEVIAIGNPKGEGLSITRGIVSDCQRRYGKQHYLMSDVTINGGNSGGPLFNENGQVIAICVSKRVEADNMNFFIPISHVLDFIHRWGY